MTKIIDHHPIRFNHSTECNFIDPNWHQFAQYGDETQWQMGLEPCAASQNAISNGGFTSTSDWTVGSNWTISTSGGYASKITGSTGDIEQTVGAANGTLWKISISVEVDSGAFALAFGSFVAYITETGDYEFWAGAQSVTVLGVSGDGTTSGLITNVSAIPINQNFKAWLVDENDNDVQSFDSSNFTYIDGWLTHTIDWESLAVSAGCYRIEVSDPCICSQGGLVIEDFTTNTDAWNPSAGWTVSSGSATFTSAGTASSAIDTVMSVCDGVSYEIEYTLAVTGTCDVTMAVGGTSGTTRTSTGTYTDTIIGGSDNDFEITCSSTGAATVGISGLTIRRTKRTRDYVSVPIKVSEVDIPCTYRINFCCDADNMGAGFLNTGFSPSIRMKAQNAQGGMTADRNSYEFSTGNKSTTYYRGRKNTSLRLMCPSYVHDCLMHLGGYDHVYLNNEEVFVEDDEYPTVSWSDQTDLGTVTLTLRDKEVLIENRRITSAAKGCDPNGNAILLNGETWLDPETGETITTG